ncbi:UbiA-like protein EboC [Fulvivirga sedimenti]|uniref:UbiA-like protein EboC n=1 Tax=Fulvivirga sedimenti TaxID=2879465 RepID=A0A9X1KZ46_9BACT|nr:UbiA-like protein EboC [Fulvivirga sedimenti]MCA6074296.1 UbiA-like protein EboC [Fulvivirga sedimenti]
MFRSIRPYLVLIRPANVVTSVADVLAGLALASSISEIDVTPALLLLLATACLYAGGIVFNDYFDRYIDAEERPERPIPSGKISGAAAVSFGLALFIIALLSALAVGSQSFGLAFIIIAAALLYDRWMKHNAFMGPFFMGIARSANLLLGMSILESALFEYAWLGIIPLVFIFSVTLTSREENRGENRSAIIVAMLLDLSVIGLLVYSAFTKAVHPWYPLILVSLWAFMVLSTKFRAWRINTPENIKNAVKTGVMSLIVLDASYALLAGKIDFAVVILFLLPVSVVLARKFAVT